MSSVIKAHVGSPHRVWYATPVEGGIIPAGFTSFKYKRIQLHPFKETIGEVYCNNLDDFLKCLANWNRDPRWKYAEV